MCVRGNEIGFARAKPNPSHDRCFPSQLPVDDRGTGGVISTKSLFPAPPPAPDVMYHLVRNKQNVADRLPMCFVFPFDRANAGRKSVREGEEQHTLGRGWAPRFGEGRQNGRTLGWRT